MLELGVYQHYKGKFYSLLGTVRHSDTGEILALYIPLYVVEGRTVPTQMSVRPIEAFKEKFRKVPQP